MHDLEKNLNIYVSDLERVARKSGNWQPKTTSSTIIKVPNNYSLHYCRNYVFLRISPNKHKVALHRVKLCKQFHWPHPFNKNIPTRLSYTNPKLVWVLITCESLFSQNDTSNKCNQKYPFRHLHVKQLNILQSLILCTRFITM